MLEVARDDMIAIAEALNYHTARSWKPKVWRKRLHDIIDVCRQDGGVTTGDDRLDHVLRACCEAGADGVRVTQSVTETALPGDREVDQELDVGVEEDPTIESEEVVGEDAADGPDEPVMREGTDEEKANIAAEKKRNVKAKPKKKGPRMKGVKDPEKIKAKKAKAAARKAMKKKKAKSKKTSLIGTAIKVLEQATEPMTISQMMKEIEDGRLWSPPKAGKTPAASLGAQISTEIKKKGDDSRFVRVGRGLFGLNK